MLELGGNGVREADCKAIERGADAAAIGELRIAKPVGHDRCKGLVTGKSWSPDQSAIGGPRH